jgi:hypothetical protein
MYTILHLNTLTIYIFFSSFFFSFSFFFPVCSVYNTWVRLSVHSFSYYIHVHHAHFISSYLHHLHFPHNHLHFASFFTVFCHLDAHAAFTWQTAYLYTTSHHFFFLSFVHHHPHSVITNIVIWKCCENFNLY